MMSMKSAGRKKQIKKGVYIAAGLMLTALLGWFFWHSRELYRQRQEMEKRLAQSPFAGNEAVKEDGVIEYRGKRYERNPSVKAILCIGVDSSGAMEKKVTGGGGQADGIFLVAHDVARDSVKILMIPRDTMTPITLTDLSGNILGEDIQHITLAYGYGDGREQSCELLAQAVSKLLGGLEIDGYLAMNTSMISRLNDLAGGVTVQIEAEGLERRDPALVKGETVTLTGQQAEIFVRYRDINIDNSAMDRMSRQKQYIEGYLEAARREALRDDQVIPEIMDAIQDNMITNMTKDQYMDIGLSVLNSGQPLTAEDIWTIPGEAVTTELFDEFHHDPAGTYQMVLDLFCRTAEAEDGL